MQLTTTLNKIQQYSPCSDGWRKLLRYLGKTVAADEPLPFSVILDSNGLEDALWCCYTVPEYDWVWRLYAVWCARQVQRLITDPRSLNALDVAERHANGQATDGELSAAWAAAREAWVATKADIEAPTEAGAQAVTWVARAPVNAGAAAWAAREAAFDEGAAEDTGDAQSAGDAARETARAAQAAKFREMVGGR